MIMLPPPPLLLLLLLLLLQAIAPASHTATAATSTLCKVLAWHQAGTWQAAAAAGARPRLMHQADWLAYLLHGEALLFGMNSYTVITGCNCSRGLRSAYHCQEGQQHQCNLVKAARSVT
jgi:hypothetical protein